MNRKGHSGAGPVVEVYDTTLRDGTQMEGMSLSCEDKLRIAEHLDSLGVDFIEGGWPGSNPKDVEFFERAKDVEWKNVTIAAFGSTCRAQVRAEDDPQLRTLLNAQTPVCTIFGKTWNMHVTEVLRTTLEENLRMVGESVAFLAGQDRRVIYDAEHFFDGYKSDSEYALETLRAAARAGAETPRPLRHERRLDAMGDRTDHPRGARCPSRRTPWYPRPQRRRVRRRKLGFCGAGRSSACAGDGERVRRALREREPVFHSARRRAQTRSSCLPENGLKQLYDLSHFVAEIANLSPNDHAAYVGRSAFAHKGGVHVSQSVDTAPCTSTSIRCSSERIAGRR